MQTAHPDVYRDSPEGDRNIGDMGSAYRPYYAQISATLPEQYRRNSNGCPARHFSPVGVGGKNGCPLRLKSLSRLRFFTAVCVHSDV